MQSDDEFEFSAEDDLSCLQALIETETQLATGLLDGTDAKDADADADARKHHSEEVDDDFENEFEDLALVDVPLHLLDESVHKTPVPPLPSCGYYRCVVQSVEIDTLTGTKNVSTELDSGRENKSKSSGAKILLALRNDWFQTPVEPSHIVHLIPGETLPSTLNDPFLIDSTNGFLILHPDILVSNTLVSDSFSCLRRSVLSERIRSPTDRTGPLIYGLMLHELFQSALLSNNFSHEFFRQQIEVTVKQYLEELYHIGETSAMAIQHLMESVNGFREFQKKYLSNVPKPDAKVHVHRGFSRNTTVCVNKILDIEENIWSPKFGLKGKIDASIQSKTYDSHLRKMRNVVSPFELKTGKSTQNLSHRAQTALYTLMMSDRYQLDVPYGLLYYCRTGDVIKVDGLRDELRSLIVGRNTMATYIYSRTSLPPVIQNMHQCQRCYSLDACLVYHKATENGTAATSGLGALFEQKTGLMTERHMEFFKHWESLITLEESVMQKYRREIWTMDATCRENETARCLADMVVVEDLGGTGTGINGYKYRLQRSADKPNAQDLTQTQLGVGEALVVSTMTGQYALAIGFVLEVTDSDIIIAIDRPLTGVPKRTSSFEPVVNQDHESKTEFCTTHELFKDKDGIVRIKHSQKARSPAKSKAAGGTLYRLDKDELSTGMGILRFNLLYLFMSTGDEKTRRLVVDQDEPRFSSNWTRSLQVSPEMEEKIKATIDGMDLNPDQRKAIERALSARDYTLILGMPGTGKTSTISKLVEILAIAGKSVLITSYTHSAVDNILLKLQERDLDFLRLGNEERVHPKIREHLPSVGEDLQSVAQLQEEYLAKQIVGTTCLGVSHPMFFKRKFDVCIVDEASQITLPVCIGPLRAAETFILVGDHYQLPPVVQNQEAREKGFATSLFKLLSDAHPNSVVSLEYQYRMNEDIMSLSNELIYSHRLKCGSDAVAKRQLKVDTALLSKLTEEWIKRVFKPESTVLFLDTDDVEEAQEGRQGDLVQNEMEVDVIGRLVEVALEHFRLSSDDIGVISPYRSQLRLIQQKLKQYEIEAHTVDKYQGRDKLVAFVSFVRSNRDGMVGELLKDWRRLNVGLTRAKTKLIMVGSRKTLTNIPLFSQMFDYISSKGWVYKLKTDEWQSNKKKRDGLMDPITPDRQHQDKRKRQPTEHRTACVLQENPNLFNIINE